MGSGIFALGTRTMFANSAQLETVGHNISNANTEGYSRQEVSLATENGRYTGAGFFGRGVRIETVSRTADPYLAREANTTASVSAADQTRLEKLKQLEKVFPTGKSGMGYAASQMLNAFVDVANQPQDMSARQVVLSRAQDFASRMNSSAGQLVALQEGVLNDLKNSAAQVNSIAERIAAVNQQIASVKGIGHEPNDLLDQRDQLIHGLNKLIQVSTIEADDGTLGVFVGGGQRLVLGNQAEKLTVSTDEFDPSQGRLSLSDSAGVRPVNQDMILGGSIAGLLKVQNQDIPEARNLLGQMGAAVSWRLNQQQSFGLDLKTPAGTGGNMFSDPAMGMQVLPSNKNASSVSSPPVSMSIIDARQLRAEDYTLEVDPSTPGQFFLTRSSDPNTPITVSDGDIIDGFAINISGAVPVGDRFVLRPVGNTAQNLKMALDKPTGIAAASPFMGTMDTNNRGTATVASLSISSVPSATLPPLNGNLIKIRFTSDSGNYDIESPPGNPIQSSIWQAGTPISYNGFDLKLNGVPSNGDVVDVAVTTYPASSNGNALAMLDLRDEDLVGRLDLGNGQTAQGANITSAYAQVIGSVGVRVQGAQTAATISQTLATNAKDTLVNKVGVNLDEEAARMIQYQQSYQAAAKILQVAQSIFETLLQVAG